MRETYKDYFNKLDKTILSDKAFMKEFIKAKLSHELKKLMQKWALNIFLWIVFLIIAGVIDIIALNLFGNTIIFPLTLAVIGCYLTGVALIKSDAYYGIFGDESHSETVLLKFLRYMDIGVRYSIFALMYKEYLSRISDNGMIEPIKVIIPLLAVSFALLGLFFKKTADDVFVKIHAIHALSEDDVEYIYDNIERDENGKNGYKRQ